MWVWERCGERARGYRGWRGWVRAGFRWGWWERRKEGDDGGEGLGSSLDGLGLVR